MKTELLKEQLKKLKGIPVYRCPACRTVWLIAGGQSLSSYICKLCRHQFNPALARYQDTEAAADEMAFPLPKAA